MGKSEVCKQGLRCERCNHVWVPYNINKLPTACPKCHSPYWNKPRRNKTPVKPKPKPPIKPKPTIRQPTRGRAGTFRTAARRDIGSAGIGGAT